MATVNEQLLARLRAVGLHLPPDTEIRRTHAGAVQRSQGAWSWTAWSPGHPMDCARVGGYRPVRELVRCQWLTVSRSDTGDLEVDELEKPCGMASCLVAVA